MQRDTSVYMCGLRRAAGRSDGGFQAVKKHLRPPQPGCSPRGPGTRSPLIAGLLRGAGAHRRPSGRALCPRPPHRAGPAAFPHTPLLFILRSPAGLGVSERETGRPPGRRTLPSRQALSAPCCIPVTPATAQAPAPRPRRSRAGAVQPPGRRGGR